MSRSALLKDVQDGSTSCSDRQSSNGGGGASAIERGSIGRTRIVDFFPNAYAAIAYAAIAIRPLVHISGLAVTSSRDAVVGATGVKVFRSRRLPKSCEAN